MWWGNQNLQQRYLPSTWSRNANTAPVTTETGREKEVFGAVFFAAVLLNRDVTTKRKKQTPQLFSDNTKFPQSEWIPPCLSFTAVQLIGLILASVPLKAWCICPPAAPKGRKHNTSKPDARLLANFKEILGECVALWCLSPVTAKVTHVTGTAVLFMVLDLPLLKLFAALLFAPHLLTTNKYNWETHIDSQTNMNY